MSTFQLDNAFKKLEINKKEEEEEEEEAKERSDFHLTTRLSSHES
jgi:hypothetical protein